ncbi:MAG: hypothetical protein V2I33_23230 [Kangiellaceae bacterium]|jgi:hypothetical protein|nr:hypothetical protein [Kangiellaceae bacterium]
MVGVAGANVPLNSYSGKVGDEMWGYFVCSHKTRQTKEEGKVFKLQRDEIKEGDVVTLDLEFS